MAMGGATARICAVVRGQDTPADRSPIASMRAPDARYGIPQLWRADHHRRRSHVATHLEAEDFAVPSGCSGRADGTTITDPIDSFQ